MTDIKSLTVDEIRGKLGELGEQGFRAGQIFRWLHRGVKSFDEMTDLPKQLRDRLGAEFFITAPRIARKQVSREDGTVKYLWELRDGNCVETVLMGYKHGNTVCISSQVGCRMGCAFCASTRGGLARGLEPSELLDQVVFTQMDAVREISNIVLMGIGEPMDNLDNVLRFLKLVNCAEGLNVGMRHISLSTCGILDGIDKLATYNLQLTLSVSLHAPDDGTRSRLMPVNRAVGVDRLLEACGRYFKATGRRVSYEYAMIDGVNDTPAHAAGLVRRLAGTGSHLNLILLNRVKESPFQPSTPENLKAFLNHLKSNGINVTLRRRLGSDIDASCGQLRIKQLEE